MSNNKFFKSLLTLLLFSAVFSNFVFAQDEGTDDQSSAPRFDLGAIEIFGGLYFIDPLGIQLASTLIPYEGTLNIDHYILGTNDLISIKIDALNPVSMRGISVNPQGDINIPIVGSIKLAGLSINDAETKIANAVSEQINNPKVTITIESPRPAIIHITGGVPHPGKYIVPAQSRIDQAIFSSLTSGDRKPSKSLQNSSSFLNNNNYSFRSIEVYRADGSKTEADLIEYFRTGNLSSNPFVKDGDLIEIKRLNRETPKVSISGAVKTDYEFEYKRGDTPSDILSFGGGFEETADTNKLFIYRRSVSGIEQIVLGKEEWDSFEILPNDRVVAPFGNDFDASASAWVYGEVNIPGNFPITGGETTALNLLEIAGGLTPEALPAAAYLVRGGGQKNEIPNQFNAELMKRTSDQYVQGLEYLDVETKLSQNQVFIDLTDESQLNSLRIFDGDRLYIPKDNQTIFIFGQVNNPGYFGYSKNKSVSEYISQAGGFALSADRDRIFILKAGDATWFKIGETDLSSGDKIFVDRQPVEELNAKRQFDIQKAQLRNQRIQLIMTGITTITGIITTYVAITK